MKNPLYVFVAILCFCLHLQFPGCVNPEIQYSALNTQIIPIGKAWAGNSINAVIFRRNSVVSHDNSQYVAYYDEMGRVILAKRSLGSKTWEVKTTPYSGDIKDAHNSISLMVDGEGYLHMSWDHHGDSLRYCKSIEAGSLELTEKLSMTAELEGKLTYPEFYRLSDGNLIFLYRDGSSGNGNLIMKHYETKSQQWSLLHAPIIDGEGERNAYWQMCTDKQGGMHLSWVWRTTGDVATNHNLGYAKSLDGGKTWQKSNGELYDLPINEKNTEYAAMIPENSELINTTSMATDNEGNPYIATYFRKEGSRVPQYFVVFNTGTSWETQQVSRRTTPFSLSGFGTKRNPLSRPQIGIKGDAGSEEIFIIYRDEERNSGVSIASCKDIEKKEWSVDYLYPQSVGLWEPSYDTELWKKSNELHLFLQYVEQGDNETIRDIAPTIVSILEWVP